MTVRITALPAAAAVPLAAMHAACFPEDPWDAEALRRVLALSGAFGYLAWQEDAPAGFVLARDLGDEIEILSIGVLPARRRQGTGRALLGAICGAARDRGIAAIVLEVAADNTAARRLYAALGFVQAGMRRRYYRRAAGNPTDALIMRRGFIDETSTR